MTATVGRMDQQCQLAETDAAGHSPCRIPPAPKGGQEDLDVAVQTPPRSVGVRHLPGMGWRLLERGAGPWIWYHLIGRGGTVITVPETLIDAIEESRLRHGRREDGKFLLAFVEIYEVLDFTEREPDRQADGQTIPGNLVGRFHYLE